MAEEEDSARSGNVPEAEASLQRRGLFLRVEDWLLAGWIVLAAPALAQAGGSAGPFDSGHPIDGLLLLAGFCGAVACLATRSSDTPAGAGAALGSASIGPLVGGLMLVGGSAFAELGLDPAASFAPTLGIVLVIGVLQSHLPAVPTAVRRALVTPYLLAAGGLFWSIVRQVTGGLGLTAQSGTRLDALSSAAGPIGLLILGAAVYYAMLIYAPRQISEREGRPIEWLARFAFFVASVGLGLGWLAFLSA